MNFTFTFRHMDRSDALESYCEIKLMQSLAKYRDSTTIDLNVCFEVDAERLMTCTVHMTSSGLKEVVRDQGTYMYDCVDRVSEKLETLVRKHKERELSRFGEAEEDLSGKTSAARYYYGR